MRSRASCWPNAWRRRKPRLRKRPGASAGRRRARARSLPMDDAVLRALRNGLTCEITTIGRTSGQPRRIEIWYFVVDDQVYLTGTPGRRDWYANLLTHPRFIFHVKEGA